MTIDEIINFKGEELDLSTHDFMMLESYLRDNFGEPNRYAGEPKEPKGILWNGTHFRLKAMTNDEILQKAIEKADYNPFPSLGTVEHVSVDHGDTVYLYFRDPAIPENEESRKMNAFEIIYSHDFARAFFGEGDFDSYVDEHLKDEMWDYWIGEQYGDGSLYYKGKKWQYRLQQMVVSEDPIKYLEKYL